MLSEVVSATNALEGFATYLNGFWVDAQYNNANANWNTPPLSRADLVSRVRGLAERLKTLADSDVDGDLKRKIVALPNQIGWFQATTLPQMPAGNIQIVLTNFELIIANVEHSLPTTTTPDWEDFAKSNLVPRELAKRIRAIESALKTLEPRSGVLEEQVQRINDAHAAALDLPTDMATLREARDEVTTYSQQAGERAKAADEALGEAVTILSVIKSQEEEAKQLIANIDQAYSAATTAGLAASFTERANQLRNSTWLWVLLLVVALGSGAYLGSDRLASLQELIKNPKTDPHWIWLDASMSALSLAAPVWFAWLSTRQIGQRFRLAEDYGFKASVARAYEGYRKEAARIDPKFEARLFASALDRLDEAPLRFVSNEEHGSPYEALLASPGFQKALEKLPTLRNDLLALIGKAGSEKLAAEAKTAKAPKRLGPPSAPEAAGED